MAQRLIVPGFNSRYQKKKMCSMVESQALLGLRIFVNLLTPPHPPWVWAPSEEEMETEEVEASLAQSQVSKSPAYKALDDTILELLKPQWGGPEGVCLQILQSSLPW